MVNHKLFVPGLMGASLLVILLMQFSFIFLLLALLPSVVAWYIDATPGKAIFKTVLACNLCGLIPTFMPVLKASVGIGQYDVITLVKTPHTWLMVYAGAAAGWALVYLCRFIARFIITLTYEYRIISMERMQKKLVDEWGQQITEKNT